MLAVFLFLVAANTAAAGEGSSLQASLGFLGGLVLTILVVRLLGGGKEGLPLVGRFFHTEDLPVQERIVVDNTDVVIPWLGTSIAGLGRSDKVGPEAALVSGDQKVLITAVVQAWADGVEERDEVVARMVRELDRRSRITLVRTQPLQNWMYWALKSADEKTPAGV